MKSVPSLGPVEGFAAACPVMGRLLALLSPMVMSNVIQSIAATVNGVYIGHLLGAEAYAVMSIALPVLFLCASFGMAIGSGASIVAGKAWGAQDHDRLQSMAQTVLLLTLAVGLVMAVSGIALAGVVVQAFRVADGMQATAAMYVSIMFLALPVQLLLMTAWALLRSTGAPAAPLQASLVALLVTAIVSPLAIVCLDERGAGIVGAALAFFLAQLVSLLWTLGFVRRKGHALAAALRGKWRIDASALQTVLKLGSPVGLFFTVGATADLGLLSLVTAHGAVATASWGAVRQVMTYVQLPAMSIALAASTLAAQAIGAQRPVQMRAIASAALVLNLGVCGGLAVVTAFAGPLLVQGFVSDAHVVATAGAILKITALGNIAFGMASALTSVMRASGRIVVPTCLSLGCVVFVLNPAAHIFHAQFGLLGVWMAYPATYCCALLLQWMAFVNSPAQTHPPGR
jgi:putative MATE family efflux protein